MTGTRLNWLDVLKLTPKKINVARCVEKFSVISASVGVLCKSEVKTIVHLNYCHVICVNYVYEIKNVLRCLVKYN